ncbi:hypothetical protein HOD61_01090 [archaeon]|jgi:hypothetical protein|nr:hypothetical protein [archaeon]
MEEFRKLVAKANKHYKIADHMTYVSYRLLTDLKILINVIENINKSLKGGVDALLKLDYIYKRVNSYPPTFDERFILFKQHCMNRYKIGTEQMLLIRELDSILAQYKKSPMAFTRNEKFVIYSDGYKTMETLDLKIVKSYLLKAKVFILILNNILQEKNADYRLS